MAATGPTNVTAAFDMLLDEMQAQVEAITQSVGGVTASGDFDRARSLIDRTEKMATLKTRVASLRQDWSALDATPRRPAPPMVHSDKGHRSNYGRIDRGLCTPTEQYFLPILRALKAAGGRGKTSDVLVEVERSMRGILRDVDYQPLTANAREKRWRNRAQWARDQMVRSDLMLKGSPRGIWEISQAGRDHLTNNGG